MELEMQRENLQQDLKKMMDLLDRQKQEAAEVTKSERENEMKVFELALERDQLQRDVESSNMRLQQTEATLAQEKENYLEKVGLLQDQLHEEQRLSKETTEKLKEVIPCVSFLFIPIPFVIPLSFSFIFFFSSSTSFLALFSFPCLFLLLIVRKNRLEQEEEAHKELFFFTSLFSMSYLCLPLLLFFFLLTFFLFSFSFSSLSSFCSLFSSSPFSCFICLTKKWDSYLNACFCVFIISKWILKDKKRVIPIMNGSTSSTNCKTKLKTCMTRS